VNNDNDRPAMAIAELISGLMIAIVHIFNCLHQKGVMSCSEATRSIEETIRALPPGQQHGSVHAVLRGIVQGLRTQEQNHPREAKTDISGLLRVIEGGMLETPETKPQE